jgi:mRNA interferase MazF
MPHVPQRGEVIWIDFDPALGHEQKGKRPALVISHSAYNQKSGMCLICPITRSAKAWPYLVPTGAGDSVAADQVRAIDHTARVTSHKDIIDPKVLNLVLQVIDRLTK